VSRPERVAVLIGGSLCALFTWAVTASATAAIVGGLAATLVLVLLLDARARRRTARHLRGVQRFADALAEGDMREFRVAGPDAEVWERCARSLSRMAEEIASQNVRERDARERLEAVIGAVEEGFLVVGPDERIHFANQRLAALFEVPGPVTHERPLLEVVREMPVVEAVRSALAGRAATGEVETTPSSRRLRFRAAPVPVRDKAMGAVAVFRDVTEIRRAEAARRDFLANASHELKTPLASVRGYAELLVDRGTRDPSINRSTEAILSNAKRLTALVDDLLELSRIESGGIALATDRFDAADAARHAIRDLEPRFEAKALEASVTVSGDATWVVGDRRALDQVLLNLLDNAIKYSESDGEVRIEVGPGSRSDRLRIAVVDTGVGISHKHQPRIFERFYRVDPGRSRSLGGTGLGLAIVKHLVQGMGGRIEVESEPGRGSRFWFELPRANSAVSEAAARARRA